MNECTHPMALFRNETYMKALLDGEALPEDAKEHLEQCELCQRQLETYKTINTMLLTSLYRRECPSSATISSYSAHLLPPQARMRVEAHLYKCPVCAAEVEATRCFLAETAGIA